MENIFEKIAAGILNGTFVFTGATSGYRTEAGQNLADRLLTRLQEEEAFQGEKYDDDDRLISLTYEVSEWFGEDEEAAEKFYNEKF